MADYGGFAYDSDYYGDDLPFWMKVQRTDGSVAPQPIVPHTLDCNDMRFALPQGLFARRPVLSVPEDTFDALLRRGDPLATTPKMMSIGMHCRPAGAPRRITALQRFLNAHRAADKVWVAGALDIARHWAAPPPGFMNQIGLQRPFNKRQPLYF